MNFKLNDKVRFSKNLIETFGVAPVNDFLRNAGIKIDDIAVVSFLVGDEVYVIFSNKKNISFNKRYWELAEKKQNHPLTNIFK